MRQKQKIALCIPTLVSGGAERVISVLANEFAKDENVEVHLILYLRNEIFYSLDPRIIIHYPEFDYTKYPVWRYLLKVNRFVRHTLKTIRPDSLLSFGGRFNGFIIVSALGLGIKIFVSDRSRPGISYGKLQDLVNPHLYKKAYGIVAQTSAAKNVAEQRTGHKNIKVIPNPLPQLYSTTITKERVIVNVGRFINSKQQRQLIEIFAKVKFGEWKLWFLGDGENFDDCKLLVKELGIEDSVVFYGNKKSISEYLQQAAIFAFTSVSEGFPNSLGEAMSAGCACISYDIVAGPSDMISNGVNGYLIKKNDTDNFGRCLIKLMENEDMRRDFQLKGIDKIKDFDIVNVAARYKQFLLSDK